jgi:hypothetical protein
LAGVNEIGAPQQRLGETARELGQHGFDRILDDCRHERVVAREELVHRGDAHAGASRHVRNCRSTFESS